MQQDDNASSNNSTPPSPLSLSNVEQGRYQELDAADREEHHHTASLNDDENTAKQDPTPMDTAYDYVSSDRFRELVICFGFFVAAHTVFSFFADFWEHNLMNYRPIPIEKIMITGEQHEQEEEFVRNQMFNEKYHGETIPGDMHKWMLYVPIVVQLTMSMALKKSSRMGDLHRSACAYMVGMGLNELTTKALKMYVGYLRPVFFDLCDPNDDYTECQNASEKIRKSFPSSHSSTSFVVATLLALYLHYRFGVHSQRRFVPCQQPPRRSLTRRATVESLDSLEDGVRSDGASAQDGEEEENENDGGSIVYYTIELSGKQLLWSRLVSFLAVIPILAALGIACSRIVDNMHFPADVIAGSLIGFASAKFAHGLWFV